MVDRYTRKEMGDLWGTEARFHNLLEVEVAVAIGQAELGMIPKEAAKDISEKASFSVERILEIEKTTRHDVIAFVSNMAENIGENGRYVHYGLTSSDVLDTATSVQIKKAGQVLAASMELLVSELTTLAKRERHTLCAGRTHGMHAEPTTFGFKMLGHLCEVRRGQQRVLKALENNAMGKLSGAVGTYSFLGPEVESRVCEQLGLKPEELATQVIPRDRHAELLTSFAILGAAIERLATEVRHLQRTEMGEALEGFTPGQKGSSAMPHKRNPIGSENLTGCARLLRSYSLAAMENVALWHERDISHSSVERVVLPDAFILLDYSLHRMAKIVRLLEVRPERMKQNMDISQGQLFSSHLLLHIVDQGVSREEAYRMVQAVSHGLKANEHMQTALLENEETKSYFTKEALEKIFSGEQHMRNINLHFDKTMETLMEQI